MVSPFGFSPVSNTNAFALQGTQNPLAQAGTSSLPGLGAPAAQSYLPAASLGGFGQQGLMSMFTVMFQMITLMMQAFMGNLGGQPGYPQPQPNPYPQPQPQPQPYPQPQPQPDIPQPTPDPYTPQPQPQPDIPQPTPDPYTPQPDPYTPNPDPYNPPPPPPPPPPYEAKFGSVKGDPHFTGFDGEEYDIQGKPGKTYSIMSDKNLAFNATFEQFGKGDKNTMDKTTMQVDSHIIRFNSNNQSATVDGKKLKEGQKVDLGNGQYAMLKGGKLVVKTTEYTITQSIHKNSKKTENWINASVKTNIDPFADGTNPNGLLGVTLDKAGKKNAPTEKDARKYLINGNTQYRTAAAAPTATAATTTTTPTETTTEDPLGAEEAQQPNPGGDVLFI